MLPSPLSKHPFPNSSESRRAGDFLTPRRICYFSSPLVAFLAPMCLGERRIRWVMYIFSSIRVVLPSLGLEFLPAELSTVSFCPFRSSSTIACVCGERVMVLSEVHVVLNGDIFCGALNIDGFAIDFIFCIDVWFRCVSLGAVAAHGSKYSARFVN